MFHWLTCLAAALTGVAAADFDAYLNVDFSALLRRPPARQVARLIDRVESVKPARSQLLVSRLGATNIERVTVVSVASGEGEAYVTTFTMKRPFDPAGLMQRLGATPAGGDRRDKVRRPQSQFDTPERGAHVFEWRDTALVPLGGRRLAAVDCELKDELTVIRLMAVAAAGADGPLSRAVAAAKGHQVILAMRPKAFIRSLLTRREAAALAIKELPVVDLAMTETAVITADLGESLGIEARLTFADARTAGRVGRGGKRVLPAGADGLKRFGVDMTEWVEAPRPLREIIGSFAAALNGGQIRVGGNAVTVSVSLPLDATFNARLKALTKTATGEARRPQAMRRLNMSRLPCTTTTTCTVVCPARAAH